MSATHTEANAVTRGRLESVGDDEIVISLPHTDYQLTLTPDGPITAATGSRIHGVIRARALRIHPTAGGGKFIEPIWGAPRIVTGLIQSIDREQGSLIVDVATPICVAAPPEQDFDILHESELATFYVESGATFTECHASEK